MDTCHFAKRALPCSGPSFGFSRLITLQRNVKLESRVTLLHCFLGMCHPGCLLPMYNMIDPVFFFSVVLHFVSQHKGSHSPHAKIYWQYRNMTNQIEIDRVYQSTKTQHFLGKGMHLHPPGNPKPTGQPWGIMPCKRWAMLWQPPCPSKRRPWTLAIYQCP